MKNKISITLFSILCSCGINRQNSNGETILHISIDSGASASQIQKLLSIGADITIKDKWGHTPLFKAASYGNIEVAALLLRNGADVNDQSIHGQTPLHVAIDNEALSKDRLGMVTLLTNNNANINIQDNEGDTALHYSIKNIYDAENDLKVIQYLISKQANIEEKNASGETPLVLAVERNNLDYTKLLLQSGADINATDSKNRSALYIALERNENAIINYLLTHSAKTNIHTSILLNDMQSFNAFTRFPSTINSLVDDKTPLHIAATSNNPIFAKQLISLGAKVDAVDSAGNSPLHIASMSANTSIINLLIQNKADINLRNRQGFSPLGLLIQLSNETQKDLTAINFLRRHGAKEYYMEHGPKENN